MAVAKYIKKIKFFLLPTSKGRKLILPDPSLSTEQKMSALEILNLPQQLTYNKGVFMRS